MTGAARLRRHRQRKAEGVAVLQIEVNLLDHTEMLIAAGLLHAWDDQDKTKIEAATERFLKVLAAEHETRF